MPEVVDYESNLQFEIAIGRNSDHPGFERRVAVEAVWREMANGTADPREREMWLSHIAKRLVSGVIDNDDLDEKGKASAALRALGLYGRRVIDSELLTDLDTLRGFADLFADKKMTRLKEVQLLRQRRHFEGMSDTAAVRKIQNLLQNRAERQPLTAPVE